jgi:hypothetical protein
VNKTVRLGIALSLALTGAAATGKAPQRAAFSNPEFYLTTSDSAVRKPLVEGARLTLKADETCYGWRYLNRDRANQAPIEERLILPAPASQWNSNERTTVADDRRSALTTIPVEPDSMIMTNGWCVADGDPLGRYRIELRRNGKLIGRRNFVLVAR